MILWHFCMVLHATAISMWPTVLIKGIMVCTPAHQRFKVFFEKVIYLCVTLSLSLELSLSLSLFRTLSLSLSLSLSQTLD